MSQDLLRIVDSIARERNVDKDHLFEDLEQAMVSAARKHFNADDTEEFTCRIDRTNGEIQVFHDGAKIPLEKLGRIPAQTAKQVMIQKFREDERASIYEEFSQHVGELITGTAQRYEGGALVVTMGRAEGFMPRSEQIPGERHNPGERVRCLILDVRDEGNQVKIVLSRGNELFIQRLFEVEVPEVQERIIEIKGLAREPGHRTKIAVASIDSKVDAVGACVGVRGSRIKNIVDELGGEKIDVVRWNESSQVLIANALRPAEIVEISLCFELGRATVVVNEDQLSLAIGKRGQNVRLAARLTGWDVDILTPAEFGKGLDTLDETLKPIEGVSEEMVDRMAALGLINVMDVEEVGPDVLCEHLSDLGLTHELAQHLCKVAGEKAREVLEQQQREREEAERRKAEQVEGVDAPSQTGDQQAAAILGDQPAGEQQSPRQTESAGEDSSDIVNMLLSRGGDSTGSAEPASEDSAGDPAEDPSQQTDTADQPPHDVAVARSGQQEQQEQQEQQAESAASRDEADPAALAEGQGFDEDVVERSLSGQQAGTGESDSGERGDQQTPQQEQ